jgi:hypothetical protein
VRQDERAILRITEAARLSQAGFAAVAAPRRACSLHGEAASRKHGWRAALIRARDMDQQGKETECMDAIREAKKLSGAR